MGREKTYTEQRLLDILREEARRHGGRISATQFRANPENPSVGTYTYRFGSWSRGLAMAGLPVPPNSGGQQMKKNGKVDPMNALRAAQAQLAKRKDVLMREWDEVDSKERALQQAISTYQQATTKV